MSREGISAVRKQFREDIVERLDVLRVGVWDVLILHVPPEVIADERMMASTGKAAEEIAELAERPVILLPEGTKLTAESVEPFLESMGLKPPKPGGQVLHLPDRNIIRPHGA